MGKIGIMGGTFDPVHNGHLHLGRQAYVEYGLDCIWYMPSGQPPHKKDHHVTSVEHRCQMLRLAIAEDEAFRFSDFEVRREGNTYTAQTLALLREAYPEHTFYFILGADSLYEIETWYRPEDVYKRQDQCLIKQGTMINVTVLVDSKQNEYHICSIRSLYTLSPL